MINFSKLSLYCLLGAIFLAPLIGGGFELTANAPVYILLIFSFLLLRLPGVNEKPANRTPERWAQLAFLALSIVAGLTSVGKQASLIQLFEFAGFYLVFLSGVRMAGMRWEWLPATVIAAAGGVLGVAAIGEYQMMHAEYLKFTGSEYRVFGSFYGIPGFFNPGFFAGFLAMSLPITLGLYCGSHKRRLTLASAAACELQLAALLLTGTRFGAIAVLVAFACFAGLLLAGRAFSGTTLVRLAILAVMSAAPILLFHAPMFSRVAAAHEQSHSMLFRVLTWKATLNIIRDHPLLGVGPGAFQLIFPRYAIAGFTRLAHESYLQIGAESGVPCLAALLSGILLSIYAAIRGIGKRVSTTLADAPAATIPILCGFIAAIVGGLIRNLTDSDWFVPGVGLVFWLSLGVASAVGRRLAEDRPRAITSHWPRVAGVVLLLILAATIGVSDKAAYFAGLADSDMEHASYQEALSDAKMAVALAPLSAQYQIKAAGAALGSDAEIAEALPHALRAAQLEPTSPTPYMLLGHVYMIQGDHRAQLAAYQEAEKRDTNSPAIKMAIADTLRGMGRRNEELQVCRAAIKVENGPYEQIRAIPELVDVNYAYAHFELGRDYERQGKTVLAVKEYEAVVRRIDRRNEYKFMITQERAGGGAPRESDSRVQDTYNEAKKALARLRTPSP